MKTFKLVAVAAVVGTAVLVAAASAWAGSCGGGGQTCATHEKTSTTASGKQLDSSGFLTPYFEMRSVLASDKVKGLDKLSKNLAKETSKFRAVLIAGPKGKVRPEQLGALKDIEKAALAMKAGNIKVAREGFKDVSRTVLAYVKSYGCDGVAYSYYCDMVKESWLQETDKIGNPYYGSQMLTCGVMTGHTMNGKYMTK